MEIYRWYDVVDQANDMLLLKRRVSSRWDKVDKLGSRLIAFGKRWEVPEGIQGPVILQAKLKLNLIGRLSSMFYKVYPPRIRVEYENGAVAEHRLVWQNVSPDFSSAAYLVTWAVFDSSSKKAKPTGSVRSHSVVDQGCFEREFAVLVSGPLSPVPPPHEVPQPVVPVELNQMTWEQGIGRPTGTDPYVVFALGSPPTFRTSKCSVRSNPNPSAPLRIFWKTKDRE